VQLYASAQDGSRIGAVALYERTQSEDRIDAVDDLIALLKAHRKDRG
jgi:hypothetical protein